MSLLNITCPICTEVFNNTDDVYSTSCGHLFHLVCMSDWQSRSTSCPQCRQHNPTTHKVYLSFDESEDILANIEEMKQKLKSSMEKIIELEVQNSEIEMNFLKLQEQYTAVDNERQVLEENVRKMNDSEEHFMQLQGQYTESAEYVKDLENRINQLSIVNECKSEELEFRIKQNESLKAGQVANTNILSDSVLNQKIQILEHKLRNASIALEKEINTSTQLSIEKMKLECVIKNMNAVDRNKQNVPANSTKDNFKQEHEKQKANKDCISPLIQVEAESRNRCIIIKNLPTYLIVMPLKLVFINLASSARVVVSADDLLKVQFVDEAKPKLFVEFISKSLRDKFMSKRAVLKSDPLTSSIIITELMDEHVYQLYKYAKEKLKNSYFKCVFCTNNQIFAKNFGGRTQRLQIKSKQQVDELCLNNTIKK